MFARNSLTVEELQLQYEYSETDNPDSIKATIKNLTTGQSIKRLMPYSQVRLIQKGLVFNFEVTKQFLNGLLELDFLKCATRKIGEQ